MMVRQARCALRAAVARLGARRVWRKAALAVTLAGVVVVAMASSAVAAEGPVWKVVSVSSPTVLAPDTGRNEVQSVAVNATGGTFTLAVATTGCEDGAEPQTTAPIPYDASAAEVQEALEAEAVSCDVGAGNVSVTGGPGGSAPYLVAFLNARGDQPVALMTVDSSSLTGGGATVSEATRGALAPDLVVKAVNVGGAATDGSPITIDDTLPPALTATAITGADTYASGIVEGGAGAASMSCAVLPALTCSYSGAVDPGDTLIVNIALKTAAEPLEARRSQQRDGGRWRCGGSLGERPYHDR